MLLKCFLCALAFSIPAWHVTINELAPRFCANENSTPVCNTLMGWREKSHSLAYSAEVNLKRLVLFSCTADISMDFVFVGGNWLARVTDRLSDAFCRYADEKWFGQEVLRSRLHAEFDAEISTVANVLISQTEYNMRTTAVNTFRNFHHNMDLVDIRMDSERDSGMRDLGNALNKGIETLLTYPKVVSALQLSKYNTLYDQHHLATPQTYSFAIKVLNERKNIWMDHAEDTLGKLSKKLSCSAELHFESATNKQFNQPPHTDSEKVRLLAKELLAVFIDYSKRNR